MINQKAVQRFLERKLNTYDWIKHYTPLELAADIAGLTPRPDFGAIQPWQHQWGCFLLMLELKRFMLNIDMGGGKTALVLMNLIYRKQRGEKIKAIIFVPYITSVMTWIEQVEEHKANLHLVPLIGTTAENEQALKGDGEVFVICYQSAVAMVTETVYDKRKAKNKWQLTAAGVREYFKGFNTLVMDEIHLCQRASSLAYRMCRAISSQCEWAFGLTGTPFGKKVEALWPQYYLIDFGETLGPTLEFFKGVFFTQKPGYWGGYEFIFKKKLKPDLRRMLKNRSIRYAIDELHDMPEKVEIIKKLPAPPDAEGYCKAALDRINAALKGGTISGAAAAVGGQTYRVVESSYLQLRQLSSGFMTLRGEDNTKLQVSFNENPKLEALMDLVTSMPSDSKMVVFHHFVYTNELISNELKKLKIGHARVWGKSRDPIAELRKFKNDSKCRVLVINSKSGSSALNLQNANYLVFFEMPDNPIDWQQAIRRVWRPGQLKRVLMYILLVKQTKDAALYHSNKAGESLMQSIIGGRAKL